MAEVGGLSAARQSHHENHTVHCKTSSKVREANPRRKLWSNRFGLEPAVKEVFHPRPAVARRSQSVAKSKVSWEKLPSE